MAGEEDSLEKPGQMNPEGNKPLPGTVEAVQSTLQTVINNSRKELTNSKDQGQITRIETRIAGAEREQQGLESVQHIASANQNFDAIARGEKNVDVGTVRRNISALSASNIIEEDVIPNLGKQLKDLKDPVQITELEATEIAASNLNGRLIQEALRAQNQPINTSSPEISNQTAPGQRTPEDKTAALEKRAAELAVVTRAIGTGQLYGALNSIDSKVSLGMYSGKGFKKGREIDGNPNEYRELSQEIRPRTPDRSVTGSGWKFDRQVWTVSEKDGETHYAYYMPSFAWYDTRPGQIVQLDVILPNNVAMQIDQAVENDPRFPDTYFKALFPGVVGEDSKTKIKRQEATELAIVDFRMKPGDKQLKPVEIKTYPKPIPY